MSFFCSYLGNMLHCVESKREELNALCRKFQVEELYLFGSASKNSYNPDSSDLDFAVRFSSEIPVLDMAEHFFGLISSLENLFESKIDLVSIPALKNPVFIRELDNTKVRLYAA